MARAALALAETLSRDPWLDDARRWMTALETTMPIPPAAGSSPPTTPGRPDRASASTSDSAVESDRHRPASGWRSPTSEEVDEAPAPREILGRLSSAMLADIFSTASLSHRSISPSARSRWSWS